MHTVNDMFDKYEKEQMPDLSPRTKVDYGRHIRRLRQTFGEKAVTAVTRQDLSDFINVPRGKIHRNRALAVLSAAFTSAIKWGWLEGNPCSRLRRNVFKSRDRQLTEEEFAAARQYAARRRRSGWRVVLVMDLVRQTGQPQGEVLGLRWSQVDEAAGTILFRNPKTRRKVPVPVTPAIAELLEQARKHSGTHEYVITTGKTGTRYTSEGFRAMWQRLIKQWEKRTGNDRFTFHDIVKLARKDEKAKAALPTALTKTLRGHVAKLTNLETRAFIEEAITSAEHGLKRSAVVLSWVGAVAVLYDHVLAKKLVEFNAEALKRNAKWRTAATADDLTRMEEHEFLQVAAAISIIGRNVKQELEGCLKLRNGCGHPNSLRISDARVAAHIETLTLNVFAVF